MSRKNVYSGEISKKKHILRTSFSQGQMKYDDARHLWNPLRDRKGISLKDIKTYEKMKAARRYPIPEALLNIPKDEHQFFIDSIIT
jgi:hypothetical protein